MLIRVTPHDVLDDLADALAAAGCLVLRVSPGVCRAVTVNDRGPAGRTELRFFVEAWAGSRSVAVDLRPY
jgi:hypothetical protein